MNKRTIGVIGMVGIAGLTAIWNAWDNRRIKYTPIKRHGEPPKDYDPSEEAKSAIDQAIEGEMDVTIDGERIHGIGGLTLCIGDGEDIPIEGVDVETATDYGEPAPMDTGLMEHTNSFAHPEMQSTLDEIRKNYGGGHWVAEESAFKTTLSNTFPHIGEVSVDVNAGVDNIETEIQRATQALIDQIDKLTAERWEGGNYDNAMDALRNINNKHFRYPEDCS